MQNALRQRCAVWSILGAAFVLVATGYLVFVEPGGGRRPRSDNTLAIGLTPARSGTAQVYFDLGAGFSEELSVAIPTIGTDDSTIYRFPIPVGILHQLRIDYLNDSDADARIAAPGIVNTRSGRVVRHIPIEQLKPNGQIATTQVTDGRLHVTARPGANDPYFTVAFDPPLDLRIGKVEMVARTILRFGVLLLAATIVGSAWERLSASAAGDSGRISRTIEAIRRRPRTAIVAASLLAVIACCHPTIFFGRSLFSPNHGLNLLYPGTPTVPGVRDLTSENTNGSDTGAMMWQHLPYSVVQHRALSEQGELPLWNRYNSCGTTMLGQGQSMLGEPLHALVLLAGGGTWSWDLKYIIARFLFASGIGLAAFAATRRLGPAVLIGFAAPFVGFFTFRVNHPAFISFCYAPWILAAWLEVSRAPDSRRAFRWLLVVFAASWCELTSGTVKEALFFVLSFNIVGCVALLTSTQPWALKRRYLATALGFAGVGGLLSAPWWLTFVDTFAAAWTSYDRAYALRIPPGRLIGLFDSIFYAELTSEHLIYCPSANALVLIGVASFLVRLPRLEDKRASLVCLFGAVVAMSFAFEVPWVRTSWILAVPLLRNVAHIGNIFSCTAIVLLLVVASAGFSRGISPAGRRQSYVEIALFLGLISTLLAAYFAHARTSWPNGLRFVALTEHRYFFLSLALLVVAGGFAAGASFLARRQRRVTGAAALLGASALLVLLGRHGQYLHTGYDDYFLNPAPRAKLTNASPAVAWLKEQQQVEPARVVGVGGTLFQGFTGMYGLEGISGPDALCNRTYRELVDAAGLSRSMDWHFPTEPADLSRQRSFLRFLNVRFVVDGPGAPAPFDEAQPVADLDLAIFESPGSWPRAFFVDSVVRYGSASELVEWINSGDQRPFAALLGDEPFAVEEASTSPPAAGRVVVAATDYELGANRTSFTITAPGPGIAVLHETWLPGTFSVTIDGSPAGCMRVNHAFKGVWIPAAGSYRIQFTYRPPHWELSLVLAGTGLVLLITLIFLLFRGEAQRLTPSRQSSLEGFFG